MSVSDVWGNNASYETTFYVDAVEWSMSSDIIDIGTIFP
jgi:hypothetical protein